MSVRVGQMPRLLDDGRGDEEVATAGNRENSGENQNLRKGGYGRLTSVNEGQLAVVIYPAQAVLLEAHGHSWVPVDNTSGRTLDQEVGGSSPPPPATNSQLVVLEARR